MNSKTAGIKKVNKKLLAFMNNIAVQRLWDDGHGNTMESWFSKIDGSFITSVSSIEDKMWLMKKGISEQVQSNDPSDPRTSCIGFNPIEQKWYGWSHRAVFGFGIGSTCKKGDCGYISKDYDDFVERCVSFWEDEDHTNVAGIKSTNDEGVEGVQVTWEYIPEKVPNKSLHGTIGGSFMYPPKKWGKGEWIAETIEDAKQMAIDFAEGVS